MRTTIPLPRLTGNCVGKVRLEMTERGFTLLKTRAFFVDSRLPRWKNRRTVLPYPSWDKSPQLTRYGCWLERLLSRALPEETVCLVALEFRYERAGTEDAEVDRLHADGSYIRSVCTLYGPTTIYRDGGAELSVPCGQTLLMTAQGRAKARGVPCTLHRRPGAGPERALIVCSFEPREQQRQPADICRRVA